LQFLLDIITVILGYVEIDKFKAEKEGKYYDMLREMASFEIVSARLVLLSFNPRPKTFGRSYSRTQIFRRCSE